MGNGISAVVFGIGIIDVWIEIVPSRASVSAHSLPLRLYYLSPCVVVVAALPPAHRLVVHPVEDAVEDLGEHGGLPSRVPASSAVVVTATVVAMPSRPHVVDGVGRLLVAERTREERAVLPAGGWCGRRVALVLLRRGREVARVGASVEGEGGGDLLDGAAGAVVVVHRGGCLLAVGGVSANRFC